MAHPILDGPVLTRRLADALSLAVEVHGATLRKGTRIPYVSHVMAVSALALEHGADEDVAAAALLHDTVEDSPDGEAMASRIRASFGPRVEQIVRGCSDWIAKPCVEDKPKWRPRKKRYLEHLRHEEDEGTLLVSLCDKVHNTGAILANLHEIGDELWQRFKTRSPEDQIWYYSELVTAFDRKLVPHALLIMLRDNVQGVKAWQAAHSPES